MGELRVRVFVDGSLAKEARVPVREPRLGVVVRAEDVPEALPPGLTASVRVDVGVVESELGPVDLVVCPENALQAGCSSMRLGPGESGVAVFSYGPGVHEPTAFLRGRRVASTRFEIGTAPLRLSISDPSGALTYPDGGSLTLVLREESGAPIEVVAVKAYVEHAREVNVLYERGNSPSNHVITVEVNGLKTPTERAGLRVEAVVADAAGKRYHVSNEYGVPVKASEEFIASIMARIESLAREAREAASAGDLVRALTKAVKAVAACRAGGPFVDCSAAESLPASLVKAVPLARAVPALEEALRASGPVGEELLSPLLSRCREELEAGLARVAELVERFKEAFAGRRFGEASERVEEALKICSSLGAEGEGPCAKAAESRSMVEGVRRFLERDVVVEIPRRARLGWFKVGIRARNSLGEEVEGVYIDFGPAKHYLELPDERIVLPPLYPGMEIGTEVKVRSLFSGTIVVPYRVCLGDLCVDKRGRVVVGSGAAFSAPSVAEASVLVGKGVRGLELAGVGPKQGQPLPASVVVGEYTCTHLLGSGGFSVALLCVRGGVNAVLKIPPEAYYILLSQGSPDAETLGLGKELLKAFEREARVVREISHPNVVRLLEYSTVPFPYLAFEFCEYGELRRFMSAVGRFKPATALEIMIPITSAVAAAHSLERPVIHMDIKPENILITRDYVPKLTDFNIAKVIGTVSRTSAGKGYTLGYAAPEQLGIPDLPPPGMYTDVFALGVVTYELLTGIKPYPPETYQAGFRGVIKPKPASALNKEVPRDLDDVLEVALQPNPEDRYRDAAQLLKDLWDIYQQYYLE